ncbi:MAG: C_GCAxxG_C_C family protein [Deltaproteobacteria bacterium]|nr:C_GCAxxG_C_C family protein [Deltaproteobacteria bacterium]
MNSTQIENQTNDEGKINRRAFLSRSILFTATGLSLISFPNMLTRASAADLGKSREEIYRELDEKIEKFYPVFHSCSQPTLAALNDVFGLNADQTVNAINLFAGGIAGKGETCGAVTGSLLAIGYNFDVKNKGTVKQGASMMCGGMFFDRFTKEFGSIRCKEIMKHQYGKYIDYSNQEDLKLLSKPENKGKCLEVMKKAAHIAADIILENS